MVTYHHIAGGMQNGASTLKNSLMISYNNKHMLAIGPSNLTHKYLPQETNV